MKISLRLSLLMLAAALLPVIAAMICLSVFKSGYAWALGMAAVSAAFAAFFAVRAVLSGLALPVTKASLGIKCFIAADYRLESVIKKEGWPEAGSLIFGLNRLMLELSAYRAFHLNQVVEDRAKAQALVETITDGVLLVDDRGRLIYSNQKALNMLCIPGQEPDISLPGSVRQEAFLAALTGIMSSEENNLKAEVEVPVPGDPFLSGRLGVNPAPVVKSFRVTSRHFQQAMFKRPGRVIVLRDVTMEKEIESARETFFHMITHDMRTPLTSILGYSNLIRKFITPSPESEKCLKAILRSSVRLKGMIDDILTTMKLENGELTLALADAEAGELCARVFEVHEPLAAKKQIKFSVALPPAKITLSADPVLLERVITNLVGNSLKFTPEGKTVAISCSEAAGEAVFCVEDTGPGIPKEKQGEIFEKYAQMEEHKYIGFGLGLAMCKMAVELHGGRIWVESEEGKGSRFCFAVPLKQQHG